MPYQFKDKVALITGGATGIGFHCARELLRAGIKEKAMEPKSYEFKDRVALITGGATGIGLQCARALLQAGTKALTIADINEQTGEKAIKRLTTEFGPNRAIFIKTDVTSQEEFEDAFKKTIKTWNGIDILINNAGILNDKKWELAISINSTSVLRGVLLGFQYMAKSNGGKGGVIVNMASILGLQECAFCPVYTATKHFVVGLTRSFGSQYHFERTGVRILVMCPGVTDTVLVNGARAAGLSNDIGNELSQLLENYGRQPVENVSCGVIKLISEGGNGSVWVTEDNQPTYEVEIPDRKTLKKTQTKNGI